ncbi:DUF1992 domain-containing protein [Actinokineospora globicatena]|uniref:DnaJ family domain-containing protein n=1 Tax=Actinokineospora globicatena TaxID=103729 RepID=UPI0020A4CD6E|nr:DUF1992 domain-containing protein [Actinokineospora globicatena]MCP2306530.1 protein of unknown function (DUF1992) [Actinokineospora globicatena]GLW81961.1 hypothetical protein Aglo01_64420 [Actinokineospora globicatena]GLW88755.1 hypothetical protein Aglo02_63940 [Actinokineospora globicatena]
MTRRKPPGVSPESWVEAQITEAANRGDFDNLPGAGKPLPNLHDPQAWLTAYLRREGLETEALLPEPLRLRREIERLPDTLRTAPTERVVREAVADLNTRIRTWMRNGQDTHFIVPLVDEDETVTTWHATRPPPPPTPPVPPAKRPWWRRR